MMPRNIAKGIFKIIGSEKERELFLKLFQSERPESFAIIIINEKELGNNISLLAWDLAFLCKLELTPVVVFSGKKDVAKLKVKKLIDAIAEEGGDSGAVPFIRQNSPSSYEKLIKTVKDIAKKGEIPILKYNEKNDFSKNALLFFEYLIKGIKPRKFIFINNQGGLFTQREKLIDYIELSKDVTSLKKRYDLKAKDILEVKAYHQIIAYADQVGARLPIQITSSSGLLKELFTIKGSGTYLNLPNQLQMYEGYGSLDKEKIKKTIENSFGLTLKAKYRLKGNDIIFINKDYSAIAILKKVQKFLYLDKFVVEPAVQSEGWGHSLWREMLQLNQKIFWRTRDNNPMIGWYFKNSDGHQRVKPWYVFWIELNSREIGKAVNYCVKREDSFIREG